MPPTLNADTIQELVTRIQDAFSEVRRGYDFGNVERFNDEQRDRATVLVQHLMNEIEDALNLYDASDIPPGRAEFLANQLLELIHKCREYVEQHPDITTFKGEGEGGASGVSSVRGSEIGESGDFPPAQEGAGEAGDGALGLGVTSRTADRLEYDDEFGADDEFDGSGPNYGGAFDSHGEKSLPPPPPPHFSLTQSSAQDGALANDLMALSVNPGGVTHSFPPSQIGSRPSSLTGGVGDANGNQQMPPPPTQQLPNSGGSARNSRAGRESRSSSRASSAGSHRSGQPSIHSQREPAPSLCSTGRSSIHSQRSMQLKKDAAEDHAREDARLEENRRHVRAQLADYERMAQECKAQMRLDEELSRQKKQSIDDNLNRGMEFIAEDEALAGNSGRGMEFTSAGLGLGVEDPTVSTERWVKGINAKQDGLDKVPGVVPKVSPGVVLVAPPEAASTAKKPGRGVKFDAERSIKPGTVSVASSDNYSERMRNLIHPEEAGGKKDVVQKKGSEKKVIPKEELVRAENAKRWAAQEEGWKAALEKKEAEVRALQAEHQKHLGQMQEDMRRQKAEAEAETTRLRVADELRKREVASSLNPAAPVFTPPFSSQPAPPVFIPPVSFRPSDTAAGLGDLTRIQVQMFALAQMKEARPKLKFSSGRHLDFEKQMRLLNTAMRVPGISSQQRLQELQFYFEGPALQLVECFLLREDADVAFSEAIHCLKDKFGTRQESAMEMLESALSGKPVAEKDHAGLLSLYAALKSVVSIAKATGRTADFELQSVVDEVIRRKLPHLQEKWARKCANSLRKKKCELGFADFLDYLSDEHFVAEKMSRSNGGRIVTTPVVPPKSHGGSARVNALGGSGGRKPSTSLTAGAAAGGRKPPVSSALGGAAAVLPSACLHCRKGDHVVAACVAFRTVEPRVKRALVRSNDLCFICMETGHVARDCVSGGKCGECEGPHHSSLHSLLARSEVVDSAGRQGGDD